MRNLLYALFFLILASCNAAPDGFNAPVGSTIEFNGTASGFTACGNSEGLLKLSILVQTPNSVTGELEPTQNIYGQIFATGPLRLYVKSDSAEILEPVASQITRIDSDSLTFTTNRRGLYEIVVGAPGTIPGNSYSDSVAVYLGVSVANFSVDVECPDTD
ncbi:MAG: hypothetical protein KDD46_01155 [Bdellovibrionales bacterium]|nr:hypothetical protein [Bdellovibrionales bacterium]